MSAPPTIVLHHLNNSRSLRIAWLLEELQLPYTIKKYSRGSDFLAPQELKEVHPLGTAPALSIEQDSETITLPESGAIVEWLCTRYGTQLLPAQSDVKAQAKHMTLLHYAEGSIMNPLLQLLMFKIIPTRAPALMRPVLRPIFNGIIGQAIQPRLNKHFTYLEEELKAAGGEYFVAGKLTGADIMLSFPIVAALPTEGFERDYPTLAAWIKKMKSRDAYKTAIQKCGDDVDFSSMLNA